MHMYSIHDLTDSRFNCVLPHNMSAEEKAREAQEELALEEVVTKNGGKVDPDLVEVKRSKKR